MKAKSFTFQAFWAVLAVPIAFFLGQALFPRADLYTRSLAPAEIDWIGALPKLLFAALAVVFAAGVTRRFEAGNPARPAWALLTAGLLGLLLGQAGLTLFFLVQGRKDVFPSIADAFFVAGTLSMVAALVAFLRAYAASGFPMGHRWELRTMGVLATLVSAVFVIPVLWPIIQAPAPVLEKVLNVAYPVLDFLMLVPALLLLRLSFRFWGGRVWPVWGCLTAGILFTAVSDILFGYLSILGRQHLEPLLDVGYILGYGCFAGGVLYQRALLAPEPAQERVVMAGA